MRAGCAEVPITPRLGTALAGFAARQDGARGVHDDLYARALVVEDAGQYAVFVMLDLCALDQAFVHRVRTRIQQVADIPADCVMAAATHTHAAPATFAFYSVPPDPAWLTGLPDRVAGAVVVAHHALSPATLRLGVGQETTIGRNRRASDGPTDPTVSVLRVERTGAGPAVLLHYACHPTVLGPDNLMISRDYVGSAVDAVAQGTGGWAMFANGTCGDINVGHPVDRSALGLPIPGRTFERAEALGLRLASSAMDALGAACPVEGPLSVHQRFLDLPLRSTPPADTMRAQMLASRRRVETLRRTGADGDTLAAARLDLLYAELGLNWVEQRTDAAVERVELQVFTIGDLALIGLPGEFFAESGLRLRGRAPHRHTITIGYANGGVGYVPPASAFADGGYETRLAPWSRLAPEAEAAILDAVIGLLRGKGG